MLRSFVHLAGTALAALAVAVSGASAGQTAPGAFPVTVSEGRSSWFLTRIVVSPLPLEAAMPS